MTRNVAYLPGLDRPEDGADVRLHRGETPTGRGFSAPRLTAGEARAVAEAVAEAAARARRQRSLQEVVGAVSRAALALGEPASGTGREASSLLVEELGWTRALAEETLEGMAAGWSEAALWAVLEGELEEPGVLEGFREAPASAAVGGDRSRRRRALGPPLLLVVHAGNVPGVAVTAAIRGLLVRSGVLSKVPSGEPGLLSLFARRLAAEDALLGDCLATTWWPRRKVAPPAEGEWVKGSGKVVVYGGWSAVSAYRARLPAEGDLLAYGPRLGVAVLLPDADLERASAGLAEDVLAYEQGGCVSPRVVYAVGRSREPAAEAVAAALAEEARRRPPPPLSPEEATALRTLRAEAEFGGYGGGGVRLLGADGEAEGGDGEELAWTVIAGGDPSPRSEGLPRVVRVHGVGDLATLSRLLAPLEGRIQALGYAGEEGAAELAERAALLGVARVAPLGRMAWPPADWRHDGRHQLLPLLRWTDWEK